jgi:Ca2+-binding EF-hand superfamily protein
MSSKYQQNTNLQQQASTNYKEAFQLFDKRGTGRVPRDSLGDLLRACGQNPTLAEIADLEKSLGSPECVLSPIPEKMKMKEQILHQNVAVVINIMLMRMSSS